MILKVSPSPSADESCIAGVDSIIPLVHAFISDPWGDILFHEVKNCEAYQRREGGGPWVQ